MLRKLITLLLTILLGLIAVWPYSVLYRISRFIHFVLFRLLNYRKDVVQLNLLYALPDTPSEDIFQIEKKFYHHFSELVVEIIKSFFIPLEDISKRLTISPNSYHIVEKIQNSDQHIILLGSHYGNWELPIYLANERLKSHKFFAMYAPLSFKAMDDFFKERRERYGATMLNIHNISAELPQVYQQKSCIAMIADQSPTGRKKVHETRFLALDTSFFTGGERLAKDLNAMVVYVHFNKKAFAQYEIEIEILTNEPNLEPDGAITEKYVRALEKDIQTAPPYWMWSHKRWKGSISY